MAKRYQLKEEQFKNVVRSIKENYPAGVTGANIDRLSGADRDWYDYISDVDYDPKTADITFTVESYQGQSFEKTIWTGDDKFIAIMETELARVGYNITEYPEWDILDVSMNNKNIVFTVSDYRGGTYTVSVAGEAFLDILPDMDSDEEHRWQYPEPDF